MPQNIILSIARWLIENRGRKIGISPIIFPETEIVSEPYNFQMGMFGSFLPLPSMTAAILTSPTGKREAFIEGGYIKLDYGSYTLEYVDRRERFYTFPTIKMATSDGPEISLNISISYQVTHPLRILDVRNPLTSFFSACDASIKSFIRSHKHDEIINEQDGDISIDDTEIAQYIISQIVHNQACRAFTLINVMVRERLGDRKILEIRQSRLVQDRASRASRENILQQQEIADEQKILEQKKAEQDGSIKELQTRFEANRQQIMYSAKELDVELENLRNAPHFQQERYLKALEVKQRALESLIQAQAMPGFPRDKNEKELVESIVNSIKDMQSLLPQDSADASNFREDVNSTFIRLMMPKKKK